MLESVRIILVDTTHPGNIGAAARAMKNMGFAELYLVNPKKFPDGLATAMASGADDLLAKAVVLEDLKSALADCDLILGTSARSRTLPWPLINPEECAAKILEESGRKVAIVFGREHAGLTNEELALCHYHIQIPTVEDFSSLNLAAAVLVIGYAIRAAYLKQAGNPSAKQRKQLASGDDLTGFFDHLEETLIQIQFLDPNHPKRLMMRLKRLFNRAEPDKTEINILRGILSTLQKDE